MPAKGVVDRQRVAEGLIASARTHAQEVGERLQTNLAEPLPDGETLPDFTRLHLGLARLVEAHLAGLIESDEARVAELADDPPARRRRDEAAAAVYEHIVTVRQTVRGILGADREAALLGLRGRTSETPRVLERQAQRRLQSLEEHRDDLPAPRLCGIELDLEPATEALRARLAELSAALRDADVERLQAEEVRQSRDEALEAYDDLVRWVASLLKGCYEMAGLSECARRIRISRPKRRVADAASGKEG